MTPKPKRLTWDTVDLTGFLEDVIGDANAEVLRPSELVGGASKDIWTFEVDRESGSAPTRYVLRRSSHALSSTGLNIEGEFAVMQAAHRAGVLLPKPHWLGEDAEGNPFCVIDYCEGEALVPRLFRQEVYDGVRSKMAGQLGRLLAPVHRIEKSDELRKALGEPPADNPAKIQLGLFDAVLRSVQKEPHPVFELAFAYLRDRLPERSEVCLVHGDYRLGNVMFGVEGIRAILDWELAHWGDPLEDISWPMVRAWRFGRDHLPVGGVGTREELIAGYVEAGGAPVDRAGVHWWEIFGNLKWGIITLMQASHFLDGRTRSLEKAVIGRRASEVEAELLHLMQSE